MRHILIILSLLLLFSSTFISCSKSSDDGSSTTSTTSDNDTTNDDDTTTTDNTTPYFVSVGTSGSIFTSSYGTKWTDRTTVTSNSLYGITYGNDTFVTVGGRPDNNWGPYILTSSDGITWTLRDSGSHSEGFMRGVTYGNGTFVTVGTGGYIYTSSDNGTNWTSNTVTSGFSSTHHKGVTFGNNTFVTVGNQGRIYTSSDNGTNWTEVDPKSRTVSLMS